MISRGRYALIFGFLLIVFITAGYMMSASRGQYPEAATIGEGTLSFEELSDRFVQLAERKGAVYAFNVLKIAPLPLGVDLHLMGHVVGDELYKQKGIDGIADCTQDFRNACSHTIAIGELNEFGTGDATVKSIQNACRKAPGGAGAYTMCFHGLGHGVFAYFGYDLAKAVALCKDFGTSAAGNQEYTQCVGGIIMELIDGGGHDVEGWIAARKKYLDADDPLAPCDRTLVPYEAKSFCYSYLTPHLFQAAGADLGNPDPATFPKAFSYCDKISDTVLRHVCYGGFGKEFIPIAAGRDIRSIDQMSDAQYGQAIQWCLLGGSKDARGACISEEVDSIFWGGENDPSASFRYCSSVPADFTGICYTQLAFNIKRYLQGDTRALWCAKVPETERSGCII